MTDTEATLLKSQIERERHSAMLKQVAASRVLKKFAERHNWSTEDLDLVHQSLGLDDEIVMVAFETIQSPRFI